MDLKHDDASDVVISIKLKRVAFSVRSIGLEVSSFFPPVAVGTLDWDELD